MSNQPWQNQPQPQGGYPPAQGGYPPPQSYGPPQPYGPPPQGFGPPPPRSNTALWVTIGVLVVALVTGVVLWLTVFNKKDEGGTQPSATTQPTGKNTAVPNEPVPVPASGRADPPKANPVDPPAADPVDPPASDPGKPPAGDGELPPLPDEVAGFKKFDMGGSDPGGSSAVLGAYSSGGQSVGMTHTAGLSVESVKAGMKETQQIGSWVCGDQAGSPVCLTEAYDGVVLISAAGGSMDAKATANWGDQFLAAWK